METIHLKTVDPVSQDLLRLAAKNGVSLNWDRYQKLQPQDGFLRLGLSCPFGCLQGPCRIDPFGRGSDRGICGLDGDGMVAAMLLRICLHGTLTILNDARQTGKKPSVSFAAGLEKTATKAGRKLGVDSLGTDEIFKAAALLQRPAASFEEILDQALILSLLAAGLLRPSSSSGRNKKRAVRAGYGVLAGDNVTIAVAGRPPAKLLAALLSPAVRQPHGSVRVVTLGDWISSDSAFLPIACSSGEAELLLSSHAIHTLVAGEGADPGVLEAARKLKVPLALSGKAADAAKILKAARQFHSQAPRPEVLFEAQQAGAGHLCATPKGMTGPLQKRSKAGLALLGGADSLHYPLGHLPVELATALRGAGIQVGSWGDAAVWMLKSGICAPEDIDPVCILDPVQGPLQVFEEEAAGRKPSLLQGILFTGSRDCRDLPVALGLGLLGCKVALADPVPYWGSSNVRERLNKMAAISGGRLTGFDHPVEAQELLDWFTS